MIDNSVPPLNAIASPKMFLLQPTIANSENTTNDVKLTPINTGVIFASACTMSEQNAARIMRRKVKFSVDHPLRNEDSTPTANANAHTKKTKRQEDVSLTSSG